jgi:hypothetical protein
VLDAKCYGRTLGFHITPKWTKPLPRKGYNQKALLNEKVSINTGQGKAAALTPNSIVKKHCIL